MKRKKEFQHLNKKRFVKAVYSLSMIASLIGVQLVQTTSALALTKESSTKTTKTEEKTATAQSSEALVDEKINSVETLIGEKAASAKKLSKLARAASGNSLVDQYGGKIYTINDVAAEASTLGLGTIIEGGNKGTYGGATYDAADTTQSIANTSIGDIWVDDASNPTIAGVKDFAGAANALGTKSITKIYHLASFFTPEGNSAVWNNGIRVSATYSDTGATNIANVTSTTSDIRNFVRLTGTEISRPVEIDGQGFEVDFGRVMIRTMDATQAANATLAAGTSWDIMIKNMTVYAANHNGFYVSPNMSDAYNDSTTGRTKRTHARLAFQDINYTGTQSVYFPNGNLELSGQVNFQQAISYQSSIRGVGRQFKPSHPLEGQPLTEVKNLTVKADAEIYGYSFATGFSSNGGGTTIFEEGSLTTIVAGT
ncbi:MAG: hypothetical protein LBS33_02675, partial [Streptococcaceae bacterium]|nr:hypothetical protein [Streptococcaceae bacterium]